MRTVKISEKLDEALERFRIQRKRLGQRANVLAEHLTKEEALKSPEINRVLTKQERLDEAICYAEQTVFELREGSLCDL